MKILRFIFQDFWRKLVALLFAVVIYWQVGNTVKKNVPVGVSPERTGEKASVREQATTEYRRIMDFPVSIHSGDAASRRAGVAPGTKPTVKVSLRGIGAEVPALRSGDLLFYVEVPEDLPPGVYDLPVFCHIRRSGIGVLSVEPAEMKISVIEDPVKINHK